MGVTKTHFKKLLCMTPQSEISMQRAHKTKWHMFFKQRINPNHYIQFILTPFFGESLWITLCRTMPWSIPQIYESLHENRVLAIDW